MFLHDKYNVTSSTDINVLKSLSRNSDFDLLILDSEPGGDIEKICREIKTTSPDLKIVLTYVYNSKINDADKRIRNCVSKIFYKPFDLAEVSKSLNKIISNSQTQVI